MAKTKDRLMLEKIFNTVRDNATFDSYCETGQKTLTELAKHLNRSVEELGAEPKVVFLELQTDQFDVPGVFGDVEVKDADFEVTVVVKYKGKEIKTIIDSVEVIDY